MKTICGTILLAALQFAAFGATYKVDVDSPSGVYSCGETAALGITRMGTGPTKRLQMGRFTGLSV